MENPSASDYFGLLGLPRRYALGRDEIEQRYLGVAAEAHPDRFVGADAPAQRAAMERSAAINEAYRTLRDPVKRAEYLVKLGGIDLDSSDPQRGAPSMDQVFLMEMIERREEAEDARSRGPTGLEAYRARLEEEHDHTLDQAVDALEKGEVRMAARLLVVRRYLQRLLDEIDERE